MRNTDIFLRKIFSENCRRCRHCRQNTNGKSPLALRRQYRRQKTKKRITETTCDTPLNCYFDYPADRCFWKAEQLQAKS